MSDAADTVLPDEVPNPDVWLTEYQRERVRVLERENEYLRDERIRLERILALALRLAVHGTDIQPCALCDVLCTLTGSNPARAAYLQRREQEAHQHAQNDKVLRVLRDTA